MKVKLEERYKEFYTVLDAEIAKAVIASEKDDEWTAKEWAEYAIREALKESDGSYKDYLKEVLKAEAHTAKNRRVWNVYPIGDETNNGDSRDMDIWIEAVAETDSGFIKVGAYLSDIWGTCGELTYQWHEYIEYYTKQK